MSKWIYIDKALEAFLDKEVPKTEDGIREETYSTQLKRLLKIKER